MLTLIRNIDKNKNSRTCVDLYENKETERFYVVKRIGISKHNLSKIDKEQEILYKIKELKHPCLVPFVKAKRDSKQAYFLFKYIPDSFDLKKLIIDRAKGKTNLLPCEQFLIVERLLLGLIHLHSHGIAHRDIKPENVLLIRSELRPIYIDFEFSTDNAPPFRPKVGTPNYISPEILIDSDEITFETIKKSDVFALGVTILYLCTGKRLWKEKDNLQNLFDEIKTVRQIDIEVRLENIYYQTGSFCIELIRGMLRRDWKRRFTAKRSLKVWYRGVDTLLRDRGMELKQRFSKITDFKQIMKTI